MARFLFVLAFIPSLLAAQILPRPGMPARVTRSPARHLVAEGVIVRVSGDSLVLQSARAVTTSYVLHDTLRLELPIGARRHTLQGAAIGLGVGAVIGGVIGVAMYQKPDCRDTFFCLDFGPGFSAAAGGALGGLVGVVLGALQGHSQVTHLWGVAPRAAQPVVMRPQGGGVGLGVNLSF